jgi:hypothetical protein
MTIYSIKKFITPFFILSATISVILASSCTTLTNDIEIDTYADGRIDFSAYKTYAWAGSAQVIYDPVGQWEQPTLDTDEEVRFVINREMRNHGIYQTDKHPDLLVAYAAGIDTATLELKEDPSSNKEIIQTVPRAALVIALVDANTGYVVWFGSAEGYAQSQRSIDDIRTRIDYAITEIFKSFE